MFKCLFCGLDNPSEKARFCVECGPDSAAKNWTPEDIDLPQKVNQYVSMLSEFYFDAPNSSAVDRFSLRIREKFKISHDTHASVLLKLDKQKQAITHLSNFRFEFNENVIDAYAGHDTFLDFRYTNLSEDDLFKVSLFWDDPDTTDRIDLRAVTKSFIKPLTSITIGASAIFDRIGIKELSDFQITITDQFGESAKFRVESFKFKVGNHEQKITQNISTHNQISIEGRGVVDASGMGAEKPPSQTGMSCQPRWKELQFTYISELTIDFSPLPTVATDPEVQQNLEILINTGITSGEFDKDNLLSVLTAAEQGDAIAQKTLGFMYQNGEGVVKNDEQALHWFRKAAEQGNAAGQVSVGYHYAMGLGVAKDDEQAVHWYRKAAEQGNVAGQWCLGEMYRTGTGVAKNGEKAVDWFRKAAEQGNASGQLSLANMYRDGEGVAKNDEKAADWYRKAAEQGNAAGQNWLGDMYSHGLGIAIDDEQAVYWYRKAAEQGDSYGQCELGDMYLKGKGVAKNDEKALDWYRKSAEQEYAQGQYSLGYVYEFGVGVAQNFEQAVYWYRKAAEQGNQNAIESLKGLESAEAATDETENDDGDKVPDLIWDDGSTYFGDVENGQPNGFGTFNFANGNSMYGIFVNGFIYDDTAHFDFADGGTYDGPMTNSDFNGFGTRTFGGDYVGHSYTGNFENDYFNGEGTYTFPDGSTNVGQFKDGVFVPPDAPEPDNTYTGASVNGLPHGVGKMIHSNGDVYIGEFVNGARHGLGEYTFANGAQQTGRFIENVFHKQATIMEIMKIQYRVGQM